MASDTLIWADFNLWGDAVALHVRWVEGGEHLRHDEYWDEPLDPRELQALIEFVLGTS